MNAPKLILTNKVVNYSDRVEIRNKDILGETDWYFIKDDWAAFEGPKSDWIDSHREKYFKYLKDTNTVVTAGTNCGIYARFYAKSFKHVYAFEPEPIAFYCMVNNTPYENVIKLNAAVGDAHGIIGIFRAPPGGYEMNIGMNQITASTEQFKIPMMTIDSLGLQACDLIQLDVEGYEKHAITGAVRTIERYKPVIVAERFGSEENQKFMHELGYTLVDTSSMDAVYTHN